MSAEREKIESGQEPLSPGQWVQLKTTKEVVQIVDGPHVSPSTPGGYYNITDGERNFKVPVNLMIILTEGEATTIKMQLEAQRKRAKDEKSQFVSKSSREVETERLLEIIRGGAQQTAPEAPKPESESASGQEQLQPGQWVQFRKDVYQIVEGPYKRIGRYYYEASEESFEGTTPLPADSIHPLTPEQAVKIKEERMIEKQRKNQEWEEKYKLEQAEKAEQERQRQIPKVLTPAEAEIREKLQPLIDFSNLTEEDNFINFIRLDENKVYMEHIHPLPDRAGRRRRIIDVLKSAGFEADWCYIDNMQEIVQTLRTINWQFKSDKAGGWLLIKDPQNKSQVFVIPVDEHHLSGETSVIVISRLYSGVTARDSGSVYLPEELGAPAVFEIQNDGSYKIIEMGIIQLKNKDRPQPWPITQEESAKINSSVPEAPSPSPRPQPAVEQEKPREVDENYWEGERELEAKFLAVFNHVINTPNTSQEIKEYKDKYRETLIKKGYDDERISYEMERVVEGIGIRERMVELCAKLGLEAKFRGQADLQNMTRNETWPFKFKGSQGGWLMIKLLSGEHLAIPGDPSAFTSREGGLALSNTFSGLDHRKSGEPPRIKKAWKAVHFRQSPDENSLILAQEGVRGYLQLEGDLEPENMIPPPDISEFTSEKKARAKLNVKVADFESAPEPSTPATADSPAEAPPLSRFGRSRGVVDLPVEPEAVQTLAPEAVIQVSQDESDQEQADLQARLERIFSKRGSESRIIDLPDQDTSASVESTRRRVIDPETQKNARELVESLEKGGIPLSLTNHAFKLLRAYGITESEISKSQKAGKLLDIFTEFIKRFYDMEATEPVVPQASKIEPEPMQEPASAVLPKKEPVPDVLPPFVEGEVSKDTAEGFAKFNITPEQLNSLKGFADLSEAQQRLVLENYKQFVLEEVKEKGKQGYQANLDKAVGLNKKEYKGWQAAPDRFWKNAFKKYYLAKETTEVANQLGSPENSKGELSDDRRKILEQLVAFSEDSRVDINEQGVLVSTHFSDLQDLPPDQQKLVDDFNQAADAFTRLPYEWSLDSAKPEQQKDFKVIQSRYQMAKAGLSQLLADKMGENHAVMKLSLAENQMRLNQFLNTHPEAEKELLKIKSESAWKQAWNNVVAERTLYAGMGFVARTATASILGVATAPFVASVMGGWLGRKRAQEALAAKDVEARRGANNAQGLYAKIKKLDDQIHKTKAWDEQDRLIKERDKLEKRRAKLLATDKNFVTAESLTAKLDGLIIKLDAFIDPGAEITPETIKFFDSLRARLEYTKEKLDDGLVNFGSPENRLINQQELIDRLNLGETMLIGLGKELTKSQLLDNSQQREEIRNFSKLNFFQQAELESMLQSKQDLVKRLERFLGYREEKISKARNVYLNKQMIKGAVYGAAFASAGAAVRYWLFDQDISSDVDKMRQTARDDGRPGLYNISEQSVAEMNQHNIDLEAQRNNIDYNKPTFMHLSKGGSVPYDGLKKLVMFENQWVPQNEFLKDHQFVSITNSPKVLENIITNPNDQEVGATSGQTEIKTSTGSSPAEELVALAVDIKAHIKPDDVIVDTGVVAKNGSVSEALDKAMTADAKVTVINPDGKVLLGADGQPVKFDANLAHEGDKVFEVKHTDGSKEIFVQKAGVTVKEGQSLAGRYDEIETKFNLKEIPKEVQDRFNDEEKGGWHERLSYQEAKVAREYWDAHPEGRGRPSVGSAGEQVESATGRVGVVPERQVAAGEYPSSEPDVSPAGVLKPVELGELAAGYNLTLEQEDHLTAGDSTGDDDDLPNAIQARTKDGDVFFEVAFAKNINHEQFGKILEQAKSASHNLQEFSQHLNVDRAEAAKFFGVYKQSSDVPELHEFTAVAGDANYKMLDNFVGRLGKSNLSLLKDGEGHYSFGRIGAASKMMQNNWAQSEIANVFNRFKNNDSNLITVINLLKEKNYSSSQVNRALDIVDKLVLTNEKETWFAVVAAQEQTDFGHDQATDYAHQLLGQQYEAVGLKFDRAQNQITFDNLSDGQTTRDVVFDINKQQIIIKEAADDGAELGRFDLTDDNLNQLSSRLKDGQVTSETLSDEAGERLGPALIESQNQAIRQAVESAAGQVMSPDDELVYQDSNGDGVADVVGLAVKGGRPYFTVGLPKEKLEGPELLALADGITKAKENLNRMLYSLNQQPGITADRAQAAEFMPVATILLNQDFNLTDQGIARAFEATSHTHHLSVEKDVAIALLASQRDQLENMSQGKMAMISELLFGQSIKAQAVHFESGGSEKLIFEGVRDKELGTGALNLDLKNNAYNFIGQNGDQKIGTLNDEDLNNLPYLLKGETPPEPEAEIPTSKPETETPPAKPTPGPEPETPPAEPMPIEANPESAILKGYAEGVHFNGIGEAYHEWLVKGGKIASIDGQAVALGHRSDGLPAIDANSAVYTRQEGNTIYNYTVIRDSAGKLTIIENKHELPGTPPPPVQENVQPVPGKQAEPEINSNSQDQGLLNLENLSHDFESLAGFKKLNVDQESVIISALQAEKAKGLKIPDNGYLIYVNKNPQAQWAALLHFDKAKNQFEVLGADVVSTANADKFAGAETPTGVHYVTRVGDAGTWGAPYGQPGHEVYDLSEGRGIAFHPTNERELLGNPASHGCVRMTDQFNDLLDKYDVLAKGSPVMIGDFLEKSELSPNMADLPQAGYEISSSLEDEVGKPYSIGKSGYDCMTLVRQAARENKGEYPVLDDYDKFLRDRAGKPEELKFSVFLREQPLKFKDASWPTVKQQLEPGEYLINMESGGGKTYGPEGHGAILSVTDDQNGNKQFTMYHASTAALMPEGETQPVPMHELRLEVDGKVYQGREIVEKFKAEYKAHINDRQADGSKLYDKWLAERVKFFDGQGNQVKPKLEADGSLRLGYVTKEIDLDSYFRYNQDFAKNIDVLPLTKETPVLAKAA